MQVGVHLTAEEAELLRRAAELEGARSLSAWARALLVARARTIASRAQTSGREDAAQGETKRRRSKKDT